MVAFIVLAFNEEDTIKRTLESIKYQIVNYGNGCDIQLVISDDSSTDNTKRIAKKWIEENRELFKLVDLLSSDKNVGTCKSFAKAFRAISTNYFYAIAGDDVLSKQNIFKKMKLLDDCDILLNGVLCFDSEELSVLRNDRRYLDIAMQCCASQWFIRYTSGIGCPIQNGVLYRGDLVTEDVLSFMERFTLLDDRTRFYAILRNKERKIRVKYNNEPVLLYGISKKSVSSSGSKALDSINQELVSFYRMQYENCRNPFVKVYLKYKSLLCGFRKKSLLYYADPYYILIALRAFFYYGKIKKNIHELLSEYADVNERYLQSL